MLQSVVEKETARRISTVQSGNMVPGMVLGVGLITNIYKHNNIHDDLIYYEEWIYQQNGSGMGESTNGSDPTLAICISLYEEEWVNQQYT